MDTYNLKLLIKNQLDGAIDGVFVTIHNHAKTKSGDITPYQELKLRELSEQLADLIFEQVTQNL